jgi:hypothetical protein
VTVDTAIPPAPPQFVSFTDTPQTFIIKSQAGQTLQMQEGYYNGAVIVSSATGARRRIIAYRWLQMDPGANVDIAQITVESSFPDTFTSGNFTISDPTDVTTDSTNPQIFVPAGRTGYNAYANLLLYNETRGEYRAISYYDAVTHLLTLDASSNPVTGWLNTDVYSIRQEAPLLTTVLTAVTSSSEVDLGAGASATAGEYYKYFVRIVNSANPALNGEVRQILSYANPPTIIVNPPFTALPVVGDIVEILPFSYDNLFPMVYTGSTVSQQQEVCYQIQLVSLILPNQILDTGRGSRIAYYPYVYVEFNNIIGPNSGVNNILYSNNPNAANALFYVPVRDISNQLSSSFIRLDGIGATQTIKFKPNDSLRFAVRLPNGELYQTIIPETYSPLPPNSDIQISAEFSVRRL